MKELSIEERAQRYDEAIERARIWKDKSGMPKDKQGILNYIFPELNESEDELIPDYNYCGAGNLNKKRMIEDFENYLKGE